MANHLHVFLQRVEVLTSPQTNSFYFMDVRAPVRVHAYAPMFVCM